MSKPSGDSARREINRVSRLERRLRQLLKVRNKSQGQWGEISALEWAIPILELYLKKKYGDKLLPVRKSLHKHEKEQIVENLILRDGNVCYLCNLTMPRDDMTIDHVMPLAKGGADEYRNYKLVHDICNVKKGNMTLEAFRKHEELAK